MIPKEMVRAQIAHHETPYVPYEILFDDGTGVITRLDAHYGTSAWRDSLTQHIVRFKAIDDGLYWDVITEQPHSVDKFGSVWRTDRWQRYLAAPAIKEPTLDGYEWPDTAAFFPSQQREATQRVIRDNPDAFTAAGFNLGLFERAWALRGFENVLMDSVAEPRFFQELVERIAAQQMQILEELAALPVDGIMFSDDWGGQRGILLGPRRWREFIKKPMRRMYDFAHAHGKVVLHHTCGNVIDVIPDAIEIGLDVLESVQPEAMDPYELKKRFGSQLAFWGGLGVQSTLPFDTPDGIRRETERLCREMGLGGGYILAPAKPLQDDTPTTNAAAVVEAFLAQSGKHLELTI